MSDEGASSAGGKRKRKATKKNQPVQYRMPEERPEPNAVAVPLDQRELRTHTLLQFMLGTDEYERCEKFLEMELFQHRTVNWGMIDAMGQRERLEGLLGQRWLEAIRCAEPQYAELTVEFHSTFKYSPEWFMQPYTVQFMLGRQPFRMSVPQFAEAIGLYTREESSVVGFRRSLRGVTVNREDYHVTEAELAEFWLTIADSEWSTRAVASSIRDPFVRYIHRIIACTVMGRKGGEDKVSQNDLFCLYCIMTRKEVNLAAVMLTSFARGRRKGGQARLPLGTYVTRLARHLGVTDVYEERLLTPGPVTVEFGVEELRRAQMICLDEPLRWEAVKQGPPHRQRVRLQSERPPSAHPRAQRQVRAPASAPVTLESLRDMLLVQNDVLRYIMERQHIEVPDWFLPPQQAAGGDEESGGDDE
ncbi:hypothetical protein HanIR_Chr15g0739491 [Helianthus annuus]|nr:hypothetical protein HanIR_Chr15g0739491 [Helianthus annuus]